MRFLVIVDMQNDFITGPLGTPEAVMARDNLIKYLKTFDGGVILTRDTHFLPEYYDSQEGKKLPIEHCIWETEGWNVDPSIFEVIQQYEIPYIYCDKESFGSNILMDLLYRRDFDKNDEFIFCGVCTDICVITNALIVKTWYPENPIYVLDDCCAGSTPLKHVQALSVMESCQIEVVKSDGLL